jgi:hypothetical protein
MLKESWQQNCDRSADSLDKAHAHLQELRRSLSPSLWNFGVWSAEPITGKSGGANVRGHLAHIFLPRPRRVSKARGLFV